MHQQTRQSVLNRSRAHRMHRRGTPLSVIAAYLDSRDDIVRRWLNMPDPGVLEPQKPSEDESWKLRGECRYVGGDIWFPETGDSETAQAAKRICKKCPVIDECREYALRNDEPFGVWGGLSRQERMRISRGYAA